jgi:hypothetical protein
MRVMPALLPVILGVSLAITAAQQDCRTTLSGPGDTSDFFHREVDNNVGNLKPPGSAELTMMTVLRDALQENPG